tara:strand:+ start:3751 stop:4023 length:273 start_codon:yes stop_codon:yes gene_type:complete
MSIDVVVSKETLFSLEKYFADVKKDILHQIGKNYLSKIDYRKMVTTFTGNIVTDMVDIIKYDILVDIYRNYMDDTISLEEFIHECFTKII